MQNKDVYIDLWMGTNLQKEEEYQDYFVDKEELGEVSQFCLDIEEYWVDPDYLIIPERTQKPVYIDQLLKGIFVDEQEHDRILQACKNLGLNQVNACVWFVNNASDSLDWLNIKESVIHKDFNGLRYIGRYKANSFYNMEEAAPRPVQAAFFHVWLGTRDQSVEDYEKYFQMAEDVDHEDDSQPLAPFCADVGVNWYDEDFIIYPEPSEEEMPVEDLLEIHLGKINESILEKCRKLNIAKANAMFLYDAREIAGELKIDHSPTKTYNGLHYLGIFEII